MALVKKGAELVWDAKRIAIGVISLAVVIGVLYSVKTLVLDKNIDAKKNEGRVAGTTIKEEQKKEVITPPSLEEFTARVEKIKKDVSTLTPEEVVKQEPVREIIRELEVLKATASSQLTEGTKNVVCEEAKKLFCK